MDTLLHDIAHVIALAIQAIAIAVVAAGTAKAVVRFVRVTRDPQTRYAEQRVVSLKYARWLVAALTFQLAADVVGTSFSPTWEELGRLAVVAAIRTFLSYFLDREIDNMRTHLHAAALPAMHADAPLAAD